MTSQIHPTAIVDVSAEVADDVQIGPFAMIGPGVRIGAGARLDARAVLERNVKLGPRCRVGIGSILGGDPQHVQDPGEDTTVEVGADTVIREYTTIHRGTEVTGSTVIGERCHLMTYVHVAHDCRLGDRVTVANAVQMAGHVEIGDGATVSGLTPIHQYVRIGRLAFVGGGSRVNQDIPPFTKAVGNPLRLYGLNTVGLERAGIPPDVRLQVKRAYRVVFNSGLRVSEGLARARQQMNGLPEVEHFLQFIEQSSRGVLLMGEHAVERAD